MTYEITIKETSKETFKIEADNEQEALEKLEESYWENPSDFNLMPESTCFELRRCER